MSTIGSNGPLTDPEVTHISNSIRSNLDYPRQWSQDNQIESFQTKNPNNLHMLGDLNFWSTRNLQLPKEHYAHILSLTGKLNYFKHMKERLR